MTFSIFNFEILKYWDILIEYLHPLPVVLWAIIGGLTGILLSIVLLSTLRTHVLIERRHFTLKWLSYSYLIILPLFIGFSFGQWAALHNCERQIIKNIPKYLGDANALYNTYLKIEVEKIISEEILKSSGNELLENAVGNTQSFIGKTLKSKSSDEIQTGSYKDKISAYLVQTFLESRYIRKLVVSEIRAKAGKALLMDKELAQDFFDVEIQKLLDNGLINTILEKHVKHLVGGFKMNVVLLLLLVIAIPLTEIIIANILYRRKTQHRNNYDTNP